LPNIESFLRLRVGGLTSPEVLGLEESRPLDLDKGRFEGSRRIEDLKSDPGPEI